MQSRRDFLRRTSLALAGGLVVGDAAMEMFERMTHRKVFTGVSFGRRVLAADLAWDKLANRGAYAAGVSLRWSDGTTTVERQMVTDTVFSGRKLSPAEMKKFLAYTSMRVIAQAKAVSGQDILEMVRPQFSALSV